MSALRRIFRDPLAHFLLGGALLFGVYLLLHGPDTSGTADGRTIVIDQPALVGFMQYQAAAFEPKVFDAQFRGLSPQARREVADSYIREEALVREARAMGLDQGDQVIRRRLVQKMLYLMDDAAAQSFAPTEAELQRYFAQHQARYRGASTLTFTHVFLAGPSRQAAERLKAQLETRHAGFNDAPGYGDAVPYLRNYVERTPDFIESQFGPEFASALETLQPSAHWQGPIRSDAGWHILLLTDRKAAATPGFQEVRAQVRDDLLRDSIAGYRDKATRDLTRRFAVRWKGLPVPPAGAHAAAAEGSEPIEID